ncbi:peptide MFS transporter [Streptomyces platensis]|uniref:peptide MFS transporter n=1 Tax=Streptomyces platensis TaxID=58346 RepID=UPI00368721C8
MSVEESTARTMPRKRHPRGLPALWGTEMWERFSYYGMRAILVLYLVAPSSQGGLGLPPTTAAGVFGVYGGLVNLLAVPGGWLADRLWGAHRTVLGGGLVIAAGHCALALPLAAAGTYLGLLLIAVGTGLLKPNISTMLGGLYDVPGAPDAQGTARRDAGFSLFYLGINIGAFAAPLVTGWLGERVDWHAGFGAAAVGMLLGLAVYLRGTRQLRPAGPPPRTRATPRQLQRAAAWAGCAVGAVAAVVAAAVAAGLGALAGVLYALSALTLVVPALYFVAMFRAPGLDAVDRSRLRAYVWIFLAATVFWTIAEQGGSLISLFAQRHIDRALFGWQIPTGWFQSAGPLYGMLLAGVFAALWLRLGHRQPSTAAKFALGLAGLGVATLLMAGAGLAASDGRRASPLWLLAAFLVQVLAELCLSPTGLSVTTRLAPHRFAGQIMSLWFLSVAAGSALSAQVVRLSDTLPYDVYFAVLGAAALLCAAAVALARTSLRRLMRGVS